MILDLLAKPQNQPRRKAADRRTTGPRKVLMFAFYFPPGLFTGAQRPFRFAKYLNEFGYATHVITAIRQREGSPWRDVSVTPDGPATWQTALASCLGRIAQRLLPHNDELPWVPHAVTAAEHIISYVRPSTLISTSPPLACHLAALAVKRHHGVAWVADFRDPLYGNPARVGRLGCLYDSAMERLIISEADAVIANTDSAFDVLTRRYPAWTRKIHLIWNGYDPERPFGPRPLPKRDYRVLLHAGSIYGSRNPSILLSSLERLFSQGRVDPAKLQLRLVGDFFWDEPWITQSRFSDLLRRGCLHYTDGFVALEEAAQEMSEADYLLLLDLNAPGSTLQVPAKLFEYIQVGRPILALTNRNSPVERILAQSGVRHTCIYSGSPSDQIDHQVLAFLELPSDPLLGTVWFRTEFDGRAQVKALAAILDLLPTA